MSSTQLRLIRLTTKCFFVVLLMALIIPITQAQDSINATTGDDINPPAAGNCLTEYTGDNVTDFMSMDHTAVQDAINAATAGATVKIAGTCAGVSNQDANADNETVLITKNITLQGGYDATAPNWLGTPDPVTYPTVLDATNNGRVVDNSGGHTVTLDGLTLQNGDIFGNGGGIYNINGSLTISNSTLSGNGAFNIGGGIFINGGTLAISNSTLSGNSATNGGGIYSNGPATISNSTLRNNGASTSGGGIYNASTTTISNSTLRNNGASTSGGGIYSTGTTTISNSTLSGNSVSGPFGGGGILVSGGTTTITNSTIAGNSATNGSNTRRSIGSITLRNTILDNPLGGGNNCDGTITDGGHNISSDASCGFSDPDSANSTNPLLDPAGLQNNGGPTQTIALQSTSPALDAGDNTFLDESTFSIDYNGDGDTLDVISTDQRGSGFDRVSALTVDIGAFEAQKYCFAEYTGDNVTDFSSADHSAVQDAINAATAGATVKIAGTCAGVSNQDANGDNETVLITKNITLQGGYDATAPNWLGTPDPVTYPTILDALDSGRVVDIPTSGFTLNVYGLILQNANITNNGGAFQAIAATLVIHDSTLRDNSAYNGAGISALNSGVRVLNSTFSNNDAFNNNGGGISTLGGSLHVTNSTFSGNTAVNNGGGISSPLARITNSTFSGNGANVGGNLYTAFGTITLRNTIVNAPLSGTNCAGAGTITDGGHNISSDPSCGFTDPDSANSTDPMLDPAGLQNNGGPTQTIALQSGSPALDAGDNTFLSEATFGLDYNGDGDTTDTITTDQRGSGFDRVSAGIVDIGAFETQKYCFAEYTGDTVTDFSSVDHTAVQQAINAASAGATVKIAGVCAGVSNQDANGDNETVLITKNITLQGGYDAANWLATSDPVTYPTVLDGTNSGRVVDNSGAHTVTIDGLTLQNGNESFGGGLSNAGTLTLTNSIITANMATSDGGGVDNTGILTITNSTISGNTASTNGGGIFTFSNLTVIDSTISGNTANIVAGIYQDGGTLTVLNSTISGNTGNTVGGVVTNDTATITNSTISDNISGSTGGGVVLTGGTLVITNSTISGNSDPVDSNINVLGGSLTLRNTIVDNPVGGGTNCNGTITDGGHNISSDISCSFTDPDSANNTNPLLDAAGLQNNGGPTQTIALQAGSPAYNAGDSTFIDESTFTLDYNGDGDTVDVITTDQRGSGFGRVVNGTVDIGAFEDQTACFTEYTGDTITDFSSADHSAVQDAINAAGAGATVKIAGVCAGVGNQDANATNETVLITKNITLQGGYDAAAPNWTGTPDPTTYPTVLDGTNNGRVVDNNGAHTVTIAGLTLQNGNIVIDGGGIYNDSGTLTISNSTINANTAANAGGIFNAGTGTITLSNSTVSGNTTSGSGGGISNSGSGTLTLNNSTIIGNNANSSGGGIFTDGAITIIDSTISGNTADAVAGVYQNGGTMTILNSTISGNTGNIVGGVVTVTATITNSTISGNTANNTGGGVVSIGGTLVITNSTISGNSDPASSNINVLGGGITLRNTIVANPVGGGANCAGAITDGRNNISSDNSCGFTAPGSSNNTDPQLDPLGLQNNGGPTQTIALQSTSPAIDIARPWRCTYDHDNNSVTPDQRLTFDQRGEVRYQGRGCDAGAYEYQEATITINEIDIDQSAAVNGDTTEFIELYDGGAGNTPIDDLILVFLDASPVQLYAALPSQTGMWTTDVNGYFVICVNTSNASAYCDFNMQRPADWLRDEVGTLTLHPSTTVGPLTFSYPFPNGFDGYAYDTNSAGNALTPTVIPAPYGQVTENGDMGSTVDSIQRCPTSIPAISYDDTIYNNPPTPGNANDCAAPFMSEPQPQPQAPALLNEVQPLGPTEQTRVNGQVMFEWASTSDAAQYHIWLMKANPQYITDWQLDAATVCADGVCRASLPADVTLDDGHYIWMVRSYNATMTQASHWSVDALFIVGDLTADFDGDGTVTPLDVMRIINRVNTNDLTADVDGNGLVNEADVQAALAQLGQTR